MTGNQSNEYYHRRYCVVRNPRSALVLVFCLALVVLVSWNGLRKPMQQVSIIDLPLYVLVIAILVGCLVNFSCFRERLIVGLAMASLVIGGISALVPVKVGPIDGLIKYGKFGLWTFALLISLSALIDSVRRPAVSGENGITVSKYRGLLVLGIVLVTTLLFGVLIYFVPLR